MKILIVDDSALSRKVILHEIENIIDVEVLEASSGEEGVELAQREKPDLITMDIEMEGMDGISAAGKIRRYPDCTHIPIIMISSKTDEVIKKIAFSAGAHIFFEKPFKQGKLLEYIHELTMVEDIFAGLRVLVVDDSSMMRKLITSSIEVKGASVIETEDAISALEIIEKQHVDLLITDLVMPGMDGVDLVSYIRNDLGNLELPIILLTAVADQAIQIEALRLGADDFLVKPFSREELISRVNNHYRRIKVSRSLNEQLYNVQKMEQVGLLLSGVMHDANNTLANIGSMAFLAERHLEDQDGVAQKMTRIQDEVERGGNLIKQLLSFSRNDEESGDQSTCFQLSVVMREVLDLFSLSKLHHIKVHVNHIDDCICIEGSKARIAQVFLNLLNNAKHAIQGRENPEICIHTEVLPKGTVIKSAQDNTTLKCAMVHISLSDNGCGIAEKNIKSVFKAFYTTKSKSEGTGLGLAMIKRTILAHHGLVTIESELNQGTSFHIYLPLKL
ncbi:MAG: response regulator [Mariprofundaceae bacterium]